MKAIIFKPEHTLNRINKRLDISEENMTELEAKIIVSRMKHREKKMGKKIEVSINELQDDFNQSNIFARKGKEAVFILYTCISNNSKT